MSDSAFVVVRLDPLDPAGRKRVAGDLVDWLIAGEIVAPLGESLWPQGDRGLGEFGPGPRWTDAVELPLPEAWIESPGEEVGVSLSRSMHSALENVEDFICARCAVPLPDETVGALIDRWWVDSEPVATCSRCGHADPLGDWPSNYPPGVVGAPAIEFRRWPPMRPDFVTALSKRLGNRCRSFYWYS